MEPQSSRPLEQTFGVGSPAPSPRGARADAYAPSPRGRGVPVASGPDAELEGEREFPVNSFDASDLDADEESVSPVERFLKYAGSEVAVQRLVQVRLLAEAVGAEGGATALPAVLPALAELCEDDDDEIRETTAEQLARLAVCCATRNEAAWSARCADDGDSGTLTSFARLLDAVVVLLTDDVDEVQEAAVRAFASLAENAPTAGHARCVASIKLLVGDADEESRVVGLAVARESAKHMGARVGCLQLSQVCFGLRQDTEFRVRAALARALPAVMAAVAEGDGAAAEDVHERLLRVFVELASDEAWSVRKAVAESVVDVAAVCDQEQCIELLEVFEELANDVSQWVRTAALRSLGALVARCGGKEVSPDVVSYFTAMADPDPDGGGGAGPPGSTDLTYECAFALPAVALTLGAERWDELRGAFDSLCSALQWKVRRTLALSLHELAQVIGPDAAQDALVPAMSRFLRDLDEVAVAALSAAPKFAAQLRPTDAAGWIAGLPLARVVGEGGALEAAGESARDVVSERCKNWRLREALAGTLAQLAQLAGARVAAEALLPAALALLRDPVASVRNRAAEATPCVLACALVRRSNVRNVATDALARGTIEALRAMSLSSNYRERQLYARVCSHMAREVDTDIMVAEFVPMLLRLASDPVANVRLELAKTLAGGPLAQHSLLGCLPDVSRALEALEEDVDADVSIQAALGAR